MNAPWAIAHIDLSREVQALPPAAQASHTLAFFWWKELPLGDAIFAQSDLPAPPERVAAAAARAAAAAVGFYSAGSGFSPPLPELREAAQFDSEELARLFDGEELLSQLDRQSPSKSGDPGPQDVSVVICTRDRPERLERCLQALLACSEPPGEIIVVDNNPATEATRRLVEPMNRVRYLREDRPGLDFARNAGAAAAGGEIVAYTDDDVTVHRGWCRRISQPFCDPQVLAVTGLVLPAELQTEAQLIFERIFGGFNRGYRPRRFDSRYFAATAGRGCPVWEIGAGANMALRKSAWERLGGFDDRLDVGRAGCNGDSEMWYRILAAGGVCYYEPQAVVFHTHRPDLESLKTQMHDYMKGFVTALLIQYEKHGHWGNLRRAFVTTPSDYVRLLLSAAARSFPLGHRILLQAAPGCAAGVGFYLRNLRRRRS